MNIGYNNRWVRLVKDLLFIALCIWLITLRRPLAILAALLGLYWYGRDAYFQAKVLWQDKHYKPQEPVQTESTPAQDSKITVTNLSDVKEVDFKKEG